MAAIKASSTQQENKRKAHLQCPVTYVMEKIGGYWKPIILYQLAAGTKRFSEIRKAIPTITEKVLIQHLKQLESDQLIIRESKPVVPPFVTYTLSPSGKKLKPIIDAMVAWSVDDAKRRIRSGI
ncbi:MAG: winged helix-turn-helix transcriptional regulator [Sphingobacteriales bacterium]|jgi:DNA-binding HxlR family transcriptional regulator